VTRTTSPRQFWNSTLRAAAPSIRVASAKLPASQCPWALAKSAVSAVTRTGPAARIARRSASDLPAWRFPVSSSWRATSPWAAALPPATETSTIRDRGDAEGI
jgi:hypothetical protein